MSNNSNKQLLRYAGLGTQFLAGIALAVYGGYHLDKWLKFGFPLGVWVLPLILIVGVIIMIVRDTAPKK